MATDLKKLLADKAKLADDKEIELAEGVKVRIGDLREYQAQVDREAQEFRAKSTAAQKATDDAIGLIQKLQSDPAFLADPNAPKGKQADNKDFNYNYEADPVLAPLYKGMKSKDEEIAKLREENKKQQENFNQSAAYILRRQFENDFKHLPKEDREGHKLEEVLAFAQQNRIVDAAGVPDVSKAVERMNEPRRRESWEKAKEEEIRRKVQEEMAMAAMPKPTTTLSPAQIEKGGATKSLDDAFAAAQSDPELAKQWANVDWTSVVSN